MPRSLSVDPSVVSTLEALRIAYRASGDISRGRGETSEVFSITDSDTVIVE